MNTVSVKKARGFGFANFFGGFNKSLDDYRLYRQTVRELSNLSDRELADLNISRWDIERIAREAVASK